MGLAGSITAARRRRRSNRGGLSLFSALSDAPSSVGRDASARTARARTIALEWFRGGSTGDTQGRQEPSDEQSCSQVAQNATCLVSQAQFGELWHRLKHRDDVRLFAKSF